MTTPNKVHVMIMSCFFVYLPLHLVDEGRPLGRLSDRREVSKQEVFSFLYSDVKKFSELM